MNIAVIFTGGTIGSQVSDQGCIATSADAPYQLITLYRKNTKPSEDPINFIEKEPYRILSENLDGAHLEMLLQTVSDTLSNSSVDGIIITHGTDTLQYTAAVLGYVFGHAPLPIVLVSSDFVLTDARANGLLNFSYAVKFIKEQSGTGVFVSYCNKGGIPTIHRGTRLQNAVSYSADVSSICNAWYGRYIDGIYEKNPAYTVDSQNIESLLSVLNQNSSSDKTTVTLSEDAAARILVVKAYPGMRYPALPSGIKAVLHESYHSGTIAINDSLKSFAASAAAQHVPVYLTGLIKNEAEYETVGAYRKLGIIPLTNCATIAAYAKLWLCISNGLPLSDYMAVSVAEDFV